jgi:hypothetical protein
MAELTIEYNKKNTTAKRVKSPVLTHPLSDSLNKSDNVDCKEERDEYIQLQDIFFQTSRQAMANKIEKYLD